MAFSQPYKIYQNSNIELAKSLIIKSLSDIEQQNKYLQLLGYPISPDPRDWKYYKNLAGEYHESDIPMYVISSDTRQEIKFDKETLKDHPVTYAEHLPGSTLFESLVTQYPDQEKLIRSILKPIDFEDAFIAKDFEILSWDESLIQSNETNLIPEIQSYINSMKTRWFIPSMVLSDEYYLVSFFATLAAGLPNIINSIRLSNVGTTYVSEWHLWTYLGGYYGLNEFKGSLSVEQALFLYRNIRHISRYPGSKAQFERLRKALLEPSGLEIFKYDMVKEKSRFLTDYSTTPMFNRSRYTDQNLEIDITSMMTMSEMLSVTEDLYPGNSKDFDVDMTLLTKGLRGTPMSSQKTTVLEVSQKPRALSRLLNFEGLKIRHWIYMAANGYYTAAPAISVPGRSDIVLSPKDAAVFFLYCMITAYGTEEISLATEVPTVDTRGILRPSNIEASEIEGLLNEKDIYKQDYLTELLSYKLDLRRVTSLDEFEQFAEEVFAAQLAQKLILKHFKNPYGEAQADIILSELYPGFQCSLVPEGVSFGEWAAEQDLVLDQLTKDDLITVAEDIILKTVGVSDAGNSLPEYQLNIIEIVRRLTPYNLVIMDGRAFNGTRGIEWVDTKIWSGGTPVDHHTNVFDYGSGIDQRLFNGIIADKRGIIGDDTTEISGVSVKETLHFIDIGAETNNVSGKRRNGGLDVGSYVTVVR